MASDDSECVTSKMTGESAGNPASRRIGVPPPEVCAVIDDVLVPRIEDIAEQITHEIHRHDAAPGDDAEAIADTRASCRANLRVTLAMWRSGQDPRSAGPTEAGAAYARLYARQGRPLADLLRVYRIGQETLARIVRHELAARLPTELVLGAAEDASSFVFHWVDAVLEQLEGEYLREREAWERSAAAMRRRLVGALLEGEAVDVTQASAALRYDLRRHHLGVVLWSETGVGLTRLEHIARQGAGVLGTDAQLMVPLGGIAVAAWYGSWEPRAEEAAAADLGALAGDGARCAVGTWRPGVAGFRASHRQAVRARRAATAWAIEDVAVPYRAVSLAALLANDEEHAQAFMLDEIAPLLGEGRSDTLARLRETLETYFDELASVARTARRLGVHENTVQHRLQRASELLGRPLRERSLELRVALELARLRPPP